MRSIKLGPALIATAAMLALAPATAFGIRPPGLKPGLGAGGCRVTANAAPRNIQSGETALIFGALSCRGGGEGTQTITIYQHSVGAPGVTPVGTATTDPAGHYEFTTPTLLTNTYFYATSATAVSGRRTVRVSPKVSLSGPPDGSQLFTGAGPLLGSEAHGYRNRVTFSGTVSPSDAGSIVVLQRESAIGGEEWHIIQRGFVRSDGTYTLIHTFAVPGPANIRVVVRANRLNSRGTSEDLSYEINQAQNPALTIQSSANPIPYGQTTTITGTIVAAAGTPLTLLARTLPGGYTTVASTTAGTGGTYTFPVQGPLRSTYYRVQGGGKTSATLFEGVKYVLTAGVSSFTDVLGQSLTFSGTVTPAPVGHPVYLEQQNPSGIGWHIVEIGSVGPGSTYSITHAPFATGVRNFRIKVPGDPENEGAVSQLPAITVTPAPAATLTPEAPGNSTLPSEGTT